MERWGGVEGGDCGLFARTAPTLVMNPWQFYLLFTGDVTQT